MIVDDDPGSILITDYLVKSLGLETATASSVSEANVLFARFAPDLAILDVMLPDGDGIDILRYIRLSGHETVVAMISASLHDFPLHKCGTDQPDIIFSKPLDFNAIRAWIKTLVELRGESAREYCSIA
jgi:two-component system OmpR family response regulator